MVGARVDNNAGYVPETGMQRFGSYKDPGKCVTLPAAVAMGGVAQSSRKREGIARFLR
jgi:hypothetical protein